MGQMAWFSHLIESGNKEELTDFLDKKGFRNPERSARIFLDVQDEFIKQQMKEEEEKWNDSSVKK